MATTPLPDALSVNLAIIGWVETALPDADIARARRELVSRIVVAPRFATALTGIEAYSHIIVLFWLDRARPSEGWLAHPRGNPELPLTGVLAGRGAAHPNPVGLAVVDLIERRGNTLEVRRLDAFNGTPVIDIKPYDHFDVYPDPRVPAWFRARVPGRRET
ncbi:MAG: tRNA (N6-threonylcarbamoyladenosine(37)-N6)-methyltransferase TrmO [Gammaproteobacteria bacterium]|nr:tRNA (N6-threonylcarbamoyladenosine(37)-N6)-methyltransferase TrmO [Gammaproteobacteria bacterium]